jgi:hypothetical protein
MWKRYTEVLLAWTTLAGIVPASCTSCDGRIIMSNWEYKWKTAIICHRNRGTQGVDGPLVVVKWHVLDDSHGARLRGFTESDLWIVGDLQGPCSCVSYIPAPHRNAAQHKMLAKLPDEPETIRCCDKELTRNSLSAQSSYFYYLSLQWMNNIAWLQIRSIQKAILARVPIRGFESIHQSESQVFG